MYSIDRKSQDAYALEPFDELWKLKKTIFTPRTQFPSWKMKKNDSGKDSILY